MAASGEGNILIINNIMYPHPGGQTGAHATEHPGRPAQKKRAPDDRGVDLAPSERIVSPALGRQARGFTLERRRRTVKVMSGEEIGSR